MRAEVQDALQRWQIDGRSKHRLIPHSVALVEAEKLIEDFATDLSTNLIVYVAASRQHARARQRFVAMAVALFAMLSEMLTFVPSIARKLVIPILGVVAVADSVDKNERHVDLQPAGISAKE